MCYQTICNIYTDEMSALMLSFYNNKDARNMEHGSKTLNISEWSNSTQNRPFYQLIVFLFYVPFTMYYNKHHRQSAQIHQIHEKISPFNLLFSFCQLNSSTEKNRKHVVMVIIRLDHRRTTNTVVAWMLLVPLLRIMRRSSPCVPVMRTHATIIIIIIIAIIVLPLRFDLRTVMIWTRSSWLINIFLYFKWKRAKNKSEK